MNDLMLNIMELLKQHKKFVSRTMPDGVFISIYKLDDEYDLSVVLKKDRTDIPDVGISQSHCIDSILEDGAFDDLNSSCDTIKTIEQFKEYCNKFVAEYKKNTKRIMMYKFYFSCILMDFLSQ